MKVVIMAGGKGTRISLVASDIPKPMIKIEGIPVLEREIECLKEQGFNDIIITVSGTAWLIPENGDFLKGSLRFFTERTFETERLWTNRECGSINI